MTDKDRMLIEELEKRLLWYREEATEEEFDAEEVDAICTMLRKLSPEEPHKSREEAYEDIMRQIRLEEEESGESGINVRSGNGTGGLSEGESAEKESGRNNGGKVGRKKRRFPAGKNGLRAAIIAIAVVGAVFSLDRVTYARENKSLFTMILERVGVVKIVKEPEEDGMAVGGGRNTGEFYESWADLSSEVKKKVAVPMYIPKDYSLYGIKCWDFNNRETLQSEYYDRGNGHLLITITLWEDNADRYRENASDEQGCVLLSEYSDENTLYYSYEDEYLCLAFMENSFYRISGNITLDELIKIREGLEDTRKK